MEDMLDILKYMLPSLVVFATAYYLIRMYLTHDHQKKVLEMKQQSKNLITPLRLQAYERVILLLERMSLPNLILRLSTGNMSAFQLQTLLIKAIRDEFDHNLSQQIYISSVAWDSLRQAKEESIKLIHLASAELPQQAHATDLATRLFEMEARMSNSPIQSAKEIIKEEIRTLF